MSLSSSLKSLVTTILLQVSEFDYSVCPISKNKMFKKQQQQQDYSFAYQKAVKNKIKMQVRD